jgi:NitT/TauT family transport system substrate-binding protein
VDRQGLTPLRSLRTVPEEYLLGDKALYIKAVQASKDAYSKTGVMAQDGMKSVFDMLKALDKEMESVSADIIGKSFEPRFAQKAATTVG